MQKLRKRPLILGFVTEIMSTAKIESAVQKAGFDVQWIDEFQIPFDEVARDSYRQLSEQLNGVAADLIETISNLRPAVILFDIGNQQIPWGSWIAVIKTTPATRRYPVICFGSHMDIESQKAARDAGADAVFARSRFFSDPAGLILQHSKQVDYLALEQTCFEPLSALAVRGLELFNRGEYFEAHEVLEEAWKEDTSPGRELYRSILQVAVAYLHIERGNFAGAVKMFLRLRQWIGPIPDQCRGVDVQRLREDAENVRQRLLALGEDRIHEFDRRLFQPVVYKS